jgi:hypothetical protein
MPQQQGKQQANVDPLDEEPIGVVHILASGSFVSISHENNEATGDRLGEWYTHTTTFAVMRSFKI